MPQHSNAGPSTWVSQSVDASKAILSKAPPTAGLGPRQRLVQERIQNRAEAYATAVLTPEETGPSSGAGVLNGTTTSRDFAAYSASDYKARVRRPVLNAAGTGAAEDGLVSCEPHVAKGASGSTRAAIAGLSSPVAESQVPVTYYTARLVDGVFPKTGIRNLNNPFAKSYAFSNPIEVSGGTRAATVCLALVRSAVVSFIRHHRCMFISSHAGRREGARRDDGEQRSREGHLHEPLDSSACGGRHGSRAAGQEDPWRVACSAEAFPEVAETARRVTRGGARRRALLLCGFPHRHSFVRGRLRGLSGADFDRCRARRLAHPAGKHEGEAARDEAEHAGPRGRDDHLGVRRRRERQGQPASLLPDRAHHHPAASSRRIERGLLLRRRRRRPPCYRHRARRKVQRRGHLGGELVAAAAGSKAHCAFLRGKPSFYCFAALYFSSFFPAQVTSGRATPEDVVNGFLSFFLELGCDEDVSADIFACYFAPLSACVEEDKDFTAYLQSIWGLGNSRR